MLKIRIRKDLVYNRVETWAYMLTDLGSTPNKRETATVKMLGSEAKSSRNRLTLSLRNAGSNA